MRVESEKDETRIRRMWKGNVESMKRECEKAEKGNVCRMEDFVLVDD
jgi:hypothetical protein